MTAFGLLFAVTLTVVSVVRTYGIPFTSYAGSYEYEKTHVLSRLSSVADLKKERLLLWLEERKSDIRVLAQNRMVIEEAKKVFDRLEALPRGTSVRQAVRTELGSLDSSRRLLQHFRTVIAASGAYRKISLVDLRTGIVVVSTDRDDLGEKIGQCRSYRSLQNSGYGESVAAEICAPDGKPYVAIGRRVREAAMHATPMRALGALFLYVDADTAIKPLLYSGIILGRTGEIVLVNRDYRNIISLRHPPNDGSAAGVLQREIRTPLMVPAVLGKEGLTIGKDYRGAAALAAYRFIHVTSDLGWGMVVKQDAQEVFEPLRNRVLYASVVSFIGIMLCVVLALWIAERISRPLATLSRAARKVEAGDLSVRSDVTTHDEVGALSESFNAMVDRLQRWNEELESEVKNRTKELHEVNETLQSEAAGRVRVEEALRRSEEQYKKISQEFDALLNAIPDRLTLQSRDLRILWANHAAVKGSGTGLDDIVGRQCHEVWHGSGSPCDPCPVLRSFSTGLPESAIMSDGEGRVWDIRTVPITDAQGAVLNVIEVGRDITDHRHLEDQLRQAQKMEAVGQLAGGVAHDFNNILTAIIGYASLMQMKLAADDPMRPGLEQILASSERAASLTHSLLAFSRKQIINPKPVDLNGIIVKVEKLISRLVSEDIDLSAKLSGEPLVVMADSVQIEQVLMNLVTNARDAMPDGGTLTIGTERFDVDEEFARSHPDLQQGSYALLSVSDTGIGMDERMVPRIFEPFFTTKELGKGTGLGLSMVYGIVRQHNGSITVYSEPEKGTTFRIYLSLIGDAPAADAGTSRVRSLRGTETVLVVEDDEHVRNITKTILESSGYSVVEARDGDEAILKFRENEDRIDLAILDVVLPKRNGKEVYEAIQKTSPGVKALFMSGYTANIVHKKGVLDEGLNFISKPAAPRELLQMVRKALEEG